MNNGTGLLASYFNDDHFGSFAFSRLEPQVNLSIADNASPDPRLSTAQPWSVRWTGFVQPLYSEDYAFSSPNPDDISKIFVGSVEVSYNYHPAFGNTLGPRVSQPIALTAGQLVPIVYEFIEKVDLSVNSGDGAHADLWWQSASQPAQPVPQSQLYPDPTNPPAPTPLLTATPQIVAGVPSIRLVAAGF